MAKKEEPLRKPQISFQVSANFKLGYDLSSTLGGLNHTRLCQAGFLFLLEHPEFRREALERLAEFGDADLTDTDIVEFVQRCATPDPRRAKKRPR